MDTKNNYYFKSIQPKTECILSSLERYPEEIVQLVREIEFFSYSINCGMVSRSCAVEYEIMIKKKMEEFVSKVHTRNIYSKDYVRKNGQQYTLWITKIDRDKRITASSKDELIEKLYQYYCNKEAYVLKNLFPVYLKSRSYENVTGKTLKEYQRLWDTYYKNDPIAEKRVPEITVKEWKDFFRKLCIDNKFTKKQFMHVRMVISGLLTYCVDEEIIPLNPIRDLNYNRLPFVDDAAYNNVKAKPFTDDEVKKIAEWCINDLYQPKYSSQKPIYNLAILLNLGLGLRYAEMCGLRWDQIDFEQGVMAITGQAVLDYKMNDDQTFTNNGRKRVEHMKSHEHARFVPIDEDSICILNAIKELGLSDEYVFPNGNFRYHTYSQKIKKAAEAVGLNPEEYHTHCLRSTVATRTYNSCLDIKQVQMLLGHTTPEMSSKYVRDWRGISTLRNTMSQVDGVGFKKNLERGKER